jgi:small-conductance mechanosensitive channel
MSEVQSLEELKSQNAAEEAAQAQQPEVEEIDAEESEDLEVDSPETTEGEATEEPTEDWLKEDSAEEEKKQSDLVPAAVLAETRRKLRGQVSEKDAEIQRLKSELDQVKASPAATSSQDLELEVAVEPWEYEGDNYGRYKAELDARNARKIMQAESAKAQQAKMIEQEQREIAEQFNQHYDRVEQFISSGKMTVEKYKAAEANVISKLNQLTGAGEVVMKKFIAGMGKGSEKVITHLGLNSASQQRLEQELKRDPSGIAAAIYLGELRKTFDSPPVNKPKTAPTPDVPLRGKAPATSSHYKAYEKAVAKDDPTAMLEAKRAARGAGIDTSKW